MDSSTHDPVLPIHPVDARLSDMMAFMYLVFAILVLFWSTVLFRKAAGSLSLMKLNMSTYVFWVLLATAFIGSTGLVTGTLEIEMLDGLLSDPSIIVVGWAGIMYAMIAVPAGMLLSNLVFREKSFPRRLVEFREREIEPLFQSGDGGMRLALMFATGLGLVGILFTWSRLESIPLLELFLGERDINLLALGRANAGFSSSNQFLNISVPMIVGFLEVATLAAYCYWVTSRRKTDLLWFSVALVATVMALSYDLSKTRVVMFMSGFLVVMVLVQNGVSRRFVAAILTGTLGLVVTMYVFFRGALGVRWTEFGYIELSGFSGLANVAYQFVTGRVAMTQMGSYFLSLELYPGVYPHIGFGSTGRMIHEVLGLEMVPNYGFTTMAHWDPAGVEAGLAGHMTSIFLGEAWANFGWLGLLFIPLLAGFVIQTFHRWFLHAKKTPLLLGLCGYLAYAFNVSTSGAQMFYYPMWLFQLVSITLAFVLLAVLFRTVRRPSRHLLLTEGDMDKVRL